MSVYSNQTQTYCPMFKSKPKKQIKLLKTGKLIKDVKSHQGSEARDAPEK